LGFNPKPFQIVEFSHRLQKDMDHHIFIIHQDPSSPDHSFLAERPDPFLFERLLNPLGNGLNLTIGLAAAEEKIIGRSE
jgi:hypothetical protein